MKISLKIHFVPYFVFFKKVNNFYKNILLKMTLTAQNVRERVKKLLFELHVTTSWWSNFVNFEHLERFKNIF